MAFSCQSQEVEKPRSVSRKLKKLCRLLSEERSRLRVTDSLFTTRSGRGVWHDAGDSLFAEVPNISQVLFLTSTRHRGH